MKLAYITASFPFGGGETFLIPEIDALGERVQEILVIPFYPRGRRRLEWAPKSKGVDVLAEGLISVSVMTTAIRVMRRYPARTFSALGTISRLPLRHFLKNCAAIPKALWLVDQIERYGISHIHAHWAATSSTMAMLASKISGIPWSFTCHRWDIYDNNLLSMKSGSAQFARFISRRGMEDAFRLGVKKSKAIIAPMGVVRVFPPRSGTAPKRVPVIFCAANLIEVKGHRYLLEAIALLKSRRMAVKLKLAGDGPLRSDLQAMVETLGLAEDVEFLGQLSQEDIFALYASGDVDLFVLPSVDLGNGHHEGVPVSLMEAMSYGIPVVSTATGSIGELLDPTLEMTVPDRNPEALAEAIFRVLVDRDRYKKLSQEVIKIIRGGWLIENSVRKLISHMGI